MANSLDWIYPALLVVSAISLGLIVEKIILSRLKKIAERTPWPGDNVVSASLSGLVFLWFFLAGAYAASISSEISKEQFQIVEKCIVVVLILSLTVFAGRVIGGLVRLYSQRNSGLLPSATIFSNLAKVFVFLIGLLMILHTLGISITPALAALGVGGLAVALALQEPLSNLFSGLQVLASQQIRPGDYLKLENGDEGYVTDITWRNTSIKTLPGNLILVPNSKIASSTVQNYQLPQPETAVLLQIGVSYKTDLQRAEEVSLEVAREVMKEVQGGVPDFEPLVRYHTFGDFSINFTLVLRGRHITDQHLLKHECIKRIHKRFKQEAIEIPFPIRTLYLEGLVPGDAKQPPDLEKQSP